MLEEQTDKLIIRIIFSVIICALVFVYKYAHLVLYPSTKQQIFKKFFPSHNPSDTLHLFSRIIGLGIIFSTFQVNLSDGIFIAIFDLFFRGVIYFSLFLLSIYIQESIALYNFQYIDEILKRRNMSYSIISFSQTIAMAILLKTVISVSYDRFIILLFLWLYAAVLFGFAIKFYQYFSILSFNRLVTQKSMSVAMSYSGYIVGCAIIISSTFPYQFDTIPNYIKVVFLKIILSLIMLPLFRYGLIFIFRINEKSKVKVSKNNQSDYDKPELGYGIYEGAIFLTACLLTSVVTGHILFGIFYPVF